MKLDWRGRKVSPPPEKSEEQPAVGPVDDPDVPMTLELRYAEAKKENPALKAVYLLSMIRRGNVFDLCLNTLKNKTRLPILKSHVSMRNAFPESQVYGCVVSSFGKSVATDEMNAVADETAELLGFKLKKVD